jgi:hypothetical protein
VPINGFSFVLGKLARDNVADVDTYDADDAGEIAVICPLVHDACRTDACAMWVNNYCVLTVMANRLRDTSCSQGSNESNPERILNECIKWAGSSSIEALHRRHIDDYLAHLQIVLDFEQHRTLFRVWRNARRIQRKEQRRGPGPRKAKDVKYGASWSDDEDEELTIWFKEGVSIESIAAHHKRSVAAIQSRLRKLGLEASGQDLRE